jgi:hypothetical protein
MTLAPANYRGYSIEGSSNRGGWSVEVHRADLNLLILGQSSFRVRHPSWTSAVAEATSRVDALLNDEPDPEPHLSAPLMQVLEAAWEIVGTTPTVVKSGPNIKRQLRRGLARCIIAFAARGITDQQELRREAVERVILGNDESSCGFSLVHQ